MRKHHKRCIQRAQKQAATAEADQQPAQEEGHRRDRHLRSDDVAFESTAIPLLPLMDHALDQQLSQNDSGGQMDEESAGPAHDNDLDGNHSTPPSGEAGLASRNGNDSDADTMAALKCSHCAEQFASQLHTRAHSCWQMRWMGAR